jgi:hypothetical protein
MLASMTADHFKAQVPYKPGQIELQCATAGCGTIRREADIWTADHAMVVGTRDIDGFRNMRVGMM